MQAIHQGEIKGLISICFNPVVSLPNNNMIREALEKLEFYCAIDFFLNETAHYADIVLAGSLHEEEEGTVTTAEGRVTRIRQAVNPPGEARTDTEIILELARRLGAEKHFSFGIRRGNFQRVACRFKRRHRRLFRDHLRENREKHGHLLALSQPRSSRHAALLGRPQIQDTRWQSALRSRRPTAIPAKWPTRNFQ